MKCGNCGHSDKHHHYIKIISKFKVCFFVSKKPKFGKKKEYHSCICQKFTHSRGV